MKNVTNVQFAHLYIYMSFGIILCREFYIVKFPCANELLVLCAGTAFGTPNWLRIVFATPLPHLEEAWHRIDLFCVRHRAAVPYTGAELF